MAPDPTWSAGFPEQISIFRQKVIATIWPDDFDELKRSIITFSFLLDQAAQTFMEHSDEKRSRLVPDKFYKAGGFNPNYKEDSRVYSEWVKKCHALIIEATKAANWMADVIRRDINPMFFATEGKFMISQGPFSPDLSFESYCPEFTADDREKLPDSLVDAS